MKKPKATCERCEYGLDEQVCEMPGFGYFDVAKAFAIIEAAPREALIFSGRKLKNLLPDVVDEGHLAHVNTEFPGILANHEGFKFVVDGLHRGTVRHRAGQPFAVFPLTKKETAQIFMKRKPKFHA